jgi:probable addiction module antidote protein
MKKITEIDNIKLEDAAIIKSDVFEDYAKYLKKNPKKLESYKKHIISEYNKHQDTALFLHGLKIVAMSEGKISTLAKKAKIERTSIYRMLSKDANPSFHNVILFAHALGMEFKLTPA